MNFFGFRPFIYSQFNGNETIQRRMVYHHGVVSGYNGGVVGDKELSDKYPDEFTNGILYGMGLSKHQYNKYIRRYKRWFNINSLKHSTAFLDKVYVEILKMIESISIEETKYA